MPKLRKCVSVLLLVTMIGCLAGCQKQEEAAQPTEYVESIRDKYEKAQSLLADNRFADAAAAFGELGSYEESAKLAMYCEAAAAGETGDYQTAFSTFGKLGDYKESSFMIAYYKARQSETEADTDTKSRWDHLTATAELYESLAGFRDSRERAEDCRRKAGEAIEARNISPSSLWKVGEEMMNEGRIQNAIRCFESARDMNAEENIFNADGLMLLGSAYEAAGQSEDAAAMYEQIYMTLPSCADAYKAHIRILQNSGMEGDLWRAGELMKTAYEKTQDSSFKNQRDDFLPKPPETDLVAGYYERKIHVSLVSWQGSDIFYTFSEDAKLPYEGTKYTEPILLEEGIHNLRAVCVSGELVSDELQTTYKIINPSPQMPQCSLAPNTYKTKQKVRLKPGKDNENDDITIYYTIDGSAPNIDSPLYNGEPIELPTGNVTLQAVAVNQYGKVSNTLVVKYKIDVNPKPKATFTGDDMISSIRFGTTTQAEFFELFGEGTPAETTQTDEYKSEIRRYDYPWGYTVMNLAGKKTKEWVVVEVSCSEDGTITGPRNTGIGDNEEYVVSQFRDSGQVESPSHNRGLYYNDKGSGKIWQIEEGYRVIRYIYTGDNHHLQLEYHLRNDQVFRIDMKYIP